MLILFCLSSWGKLKATWNTIFILEGFLKVPLYTDTHSAGYYNANGVPSPFQHVLVGFSSVSLSSVSPIACFVLHFSV